MVENQKYWTEKSGIKSITRNRKVSRLFRIVSLFSMIIIASGLMYSCKTTQKAVAVKLKPLSAGKILKNINNKSSGFDQLAIKRISCQYSGPKTNASFKASLKLIRDKKILISFSKLNIPVGRILLTTDSVKYVNYIDRNYFEGNYDFSGKFFNINVDFQDIQSIIFNNFFSYYNDQEDADFNDFVSLTDSGLYVLQSINNRKLMKFYDNLKAHKVEKYLKRRNEDELIIQTVYIDPVNFNILKMIFEDKTDKSRVMFNFGEFTQVAGKDYPGSIDMNFDSMEEKLQLNIRMSGFSTDEEGSYDFKIPERYSPVRLK